MATETSRLHQVWTRRKGTILWSAVVIMAVVIAAVVGGRALAGATTPPRSFSFTFGASGCNCTRENQTVHSFPTPAKIHFTWWTTWTGANATDELAITTSGGKLIYVSIAEYQQGNPYNLNVTWAQGGGGTISGQGSPLTFLIVLVATPDFLPPNTTIWINGTYTTPLV
jgi:hypothetical protein